MSASRHNRQLSGYLASHKIGKNVARHRLPDEVLLKLFSFLPADALMTSSCVCKRWHRLANDNSLWEQQYRLFAVNKNDTSGNRLHSAEPLATNWKLKCIRKCMDRRNARINKLLSKTSPYTNLPANIDTAIQKLGISWELVLRDHDKTDHLFVSSDSCHLPTACTIRWYSLEFPPIKTLGNMSIIAKSPVFFNKDWSPAYNGPCQRSLLIQHNVDWHHLTTSQPPDAGDDLIDLMVIDQCILVATWKNGGELAFVSVSLHNHGLVQRCTQGRLNRVYAPPLCMPKPDDIDPEYGFHGYTCIVELRNQRNVIWGQQFQNVHCCHKNKGTILKQFILSTDQNKLGTLYRNLGGGADRLLNGHVFYNYSDETGRSIMYMYMNFCILDITLHDEFLKPFWCTSSPVSVKSADDCVVNYNCDGDPCLIDYQCEKGSVQVRLIWDEGNQQFVVVGITLDISLNAINAWFSTNY